MKQPLPIDKCQVLVDSAHGREHRTVLILRFPTGDVEIEVSTYQAGRIRKLNRVANEQKIDIHT